MNVYRALRRRVLRRAIEPTAIAFDAVADGLMEMPASTVFTRDEVVGLMHLVSGKIRSGDLL
jgi:hypothetical protein